MENLKYFVYVRKSSESDDRQVQSIPDQTTALLKLIDTSKLAVHKDVFAEAHSAKKPGGRLVFEEMLDRIENGEANGILCWDINRLSRNPVDSGRIQWMLQQGIIQSIRTPQREYRPDDNALVLSVESGSANQYIIDLKKGVRRGIDSKLEKGHAPIMAPMGYKNTITEIRGDNYIIKDPERFPIVRKMWDLMLTGNYTPPQILEIASNKWGLRTRKTKRKGNKPLSRSTIYRIFTDPFYAGVFRYRGVEHNGKHPPMITFDEFDRVQILLGRDGKPRPKTHSFAFTGVITCGECGAAITAIEKDKIIKKDNEIKTFVYYYCTKRKQGHKCKQKGYTTLEQMEEQIEREISKLTIMPEFKEWALEILNEGNDGEIEARTKIYESIESAIVENRKQQDNLTRMRYRELVNDDEFARERKTLKAEETTLKAQLQEVDRRAADWLELTERTFVFASYAHLAFLDGDLQTKKEILTALGQNFTLKDKKLLISFNNWLIPIISKYPDIERQFKALELNKTVVHNGRKEAFDLLRPEVRSRRDLNPQPPA